jgi:hypothetical protein
MAAYDFIDLNGTVVADTSTTKVEVEEEQREIFGEDVDLSDESPNGVLVNSETISRNGIAVNNANLANQINPNFAGGIFLDAIWALTRALTGGRKEATHSTFSTPVDLTGVPSTFIPAGSIASTTNNDNFESVSDVTLDGSGNGSVNFQAVETGPISAGIGDLNSIVTGAPLGWETVNNTVAATLGQSDEPDEVSRQRRTDTLALQGISIPEAVKSAVSDLDGVKSLSYRENYTKVDATIDGVFLLANSIYVCVDGGTDEDIAVALLENKTTGANWNGGTTVIVTDTTSGQPYPVKFARPDEVQIWVTVTIAPTTVTNPSDVVETSVLRYANGLIDGESGFVVGASVSPFEIAGAVNRDTPEIFVRNVEISNDGIIYVVAEIPIEIFEVARTDATKITTVIS